MRDGLSARLNSVDTMEIIREKEEQIRGLLEEGKANLLGRIVFLVHPKHRLYSKENV